MRKVLLHCNTAIKSSGLACTGPEKRGSCLLCGRVSLGSKTFINILELIVPSGLTVSSDEMRMVSCEGEDSPMAAGFSGHLGWMDKW